ncbi:peptidase M48 [Endozoicomonas sp. OPT23]|uniref:M48 family metallopeptidase n=1 Tax=Endozoicomonas sp. OPT23 TaxID=2072845 RepID=UPI00129B7E09|nr:M48 family metallopeptidase [Endozoicomonas sp. OPT23]MRI32099.1 peptidase M48 [Endozoicomonas sp. OPT23]
MKWLKPLTLSIILPTFLAGCQSVSTTSGGAIGVDREQRMFTLLSEQQVNTMAADAYKEALSKSREEKVLNKNLVQVQKLRRIGKKLSAQVGIYRKDALRWNWQINLIESEQLNAYCMPGGKIMFYSGIIDKLKLNDDEIAAIMGHEMAHALREHSREAMSRAYTLQLGKDVAGALFGINTNNQLTDAVITYGLTLPNSRTNEAEADLIGLELMARAGYNPNAAVTLWQKMSKESKQQPPEFMSTHPSHDTRIAGLKSNIAKVAPLYKVAIKK